MPGSFQIPHTGFCNALSPFSNVTVNEDILQSLRLSSAVSPSWLLFLGCCRSLVHMAGTSWHRRRVCGQRRPTHKLRLLEGSSAEAGTSAEGGW